VTRGVLAVLDGAVSGPELARTLIFSHSTTVGLNALLQRRGLVTAILVTEGFRDILETRRGDRGNPYDLFWTPPPPLVPRHLRLPVRERMAADGSVLTALAEQSVFEAAQVLLA